MKTSTVMILFWLNALYQASLFCVGFASASHLHRSLSFSLTCRKNQTGHTITQLSLDNSSAKLPSQWRMSIQHNITEHEGVQSFHLNGIFVAPPTKPNDYELFPGVGYYKFHTSYANGFEEASSVCSREGGHLAILNSESEHQALQTMFARHPVSELKTVLAFVGFHDRFKEGEYVTIFGQSLNSTGFMKWAGPDNPDNVNGIENCGSINRIGGLNDIVCNAQLPFFCEYDLSWTEN